MSAAAWPFCAAAAVLADWQVLTVSADALHLLCSCWQMKSEMTLMASAEPWLKSAWSTAAKASPSERSCCVPNETAGLLHEPKSSAWRTRKREARRRSLALEAAALHSDSGFHVSLGKGKLVCMCFH